MRRKRFIKHQVQYHVLNMKKVIFSRKIITKHEQNVVKSGLNIIPVGCCEDEVNRKGHLIKRQETVYVENVKNDL